MATLVCDYDGTFHESIKIYAPAFRKAYAYLVEEKEALERAWTDAEISRWLGYNSKEMWKQFMPELNEEKKRQCSEMIGREMVRLVREKRAALYPKCREVWTALKEKGHTLIFLSNCKRGYMEAHRQMFLLDRYFEDFFCSEDYGFLPKYDIFEEIRKQYGGPYLVIGDRFQDMEVAVIHQLKSIGCAYGYGTAEELGSASAIADTCGDLVYLTDMLLS